MFEVVIQAHTHERGYVTLIGTARYYHSLTEATEGAQAALESERYRGKVKAKISQRVAYIYPEPEGAKS